MARFGASKDDYSEMLTMFESLEAKHWAVIAKKIVIKLKPTCSRLMPIADVKQKECLYRCQLKPTLGDCYHDLFESTRCSLTSMAPLHVRRKLGLVQCLHMDGRMKLVLFTLVLPEVRRCFKM